MQFYKSIQKCINKDQSLSQMIINLHTTLLPKIPFNLHGLNKQQSLSLIYQHIKYPLNKIKKSISFITDNQQQSILKFQQDQKEKQSNQVQGYQDEELQINQQDNQDNQQLVDEYDEKQQQNDNDQQQKEENQDQQESSNDVGIYGQQLDEQDMQPYENQQIDDDPQFPNFKLAKPYPQNNIKDEPDQYIDDNFDQFRKVQLSNNKEQKEELTAIQKQIGKLQERALAKKNWVLGGEVKAKQRPINSLLDAQLQFKSGIKYSHEITQQYNTTLEQTIKQRILNQLFDDRIRYIPQTPTRNKKLQDVSGEKNKKSLSQFLGLGDKTNDKIKKQIIYALKQVNYYLDTLSNTGFTVKPTLNQVNHISEPLTIQNKVPITNWTKTPQRPAQTKLIFQSQKEINKKTKRLRNKRNARQRKKQQQKKKINKTIQYGGITKFQAEARKKIAITKQNQKIVKYSKSNSFFNNINQKIKPAKPNPNISKLQI